MFLLKINKFKRKELKMFSSLIKSKLTITKKLNDPIEGIFVLGGDGTILRYLRKLSKKVDYLERCLIIAINFGSYGCLAPFDCKELGLVINKLINNEYKIIRRKRLKILCGDKSFGYALNDILLTHKAGILSSFIIEVNNNVLEEIKCDGVLISTATGSSGYNYSGKGPFLFTQDAFVINCLNPCRVYFNPLVVTGTVKVKISNEYHGIKDITCVVDGCDELKGVNEFTISLEENHLNFMSFNDETEEYTKIISRLWYLN